MPEVVARPHSAVPFLPLGAVAVPAMVGTGLLWMHHGTAVFFETIRVGFSGCFG